MSHTMIHQDFHGRPQKGIKIRNNVDYLATAIAGMVLLHFLIPVFLVIWVVCFALCIAIGLTPGLAIAAATHHAANWHLLVVMALVLGGLLGFCVACRLTWAFLRSFVKRTRFDYSDGYHGPLKRRARPSHRAF